VYKRQEATLEKWVEQGAPKEIINPRFRREYFQFQRIRQLDGTKPGTIGEGQEEVPSKIDLGHGITVRMSALLPLVPAYEPRIISEDERTVILRNARGQTTKYIKDRVEGMMPTFLDWPVKDRAPGTSIRGGSTLIPPSDGPPIGKPMFRK